MDRQRVLPWLLFVASVLAGVAMAVHLSRGRSAAEDSADQATAEARQSRDELTMTKRARAGLEGSLDRLERENGQLLELKNRLQHTVSVHEEELERLKATKEELERKIKEEIKRGDIRLSQEGDRLRVGLVSKVLFKSGEAEISEPGQELLRRLGQVLIGVEGKQIQVSGHTDTTPPGDRIKVRFPTNWELSVARATNVLRFLEDEAKIPGRRLVASGHGAHQPIATNNTPRGRAKNRRIEILLVPVIEAVLVDKAKRKKR